MSNITREAIRVLIVDDSEDLRYLLRFTLDREDGFTVVAEAEDGLEAVAAAATYQPDVVLLDISMPVMDGLQALPQIREKCPNTMVVMLSAFEVASSAAVTARALGAHGYIEKGGHTQRLTRRLRDLVGAGESGATADFERVDQRCE
jgi:DNA-binding NarL/FixJ family response regulator